jgi:hypothetical protein
MWKYISFLFIILLSSSISAQEKASGSDILKSLQKLDDSDAVRKYNEYNRKYRRGVSFKNRVLRNVGYRPIITWIPEGVGMYVGPVLVSPDRRYVRFGINMNFSSIKGFSTFNMGTGETTWYPKGE